jgi:hypothetical protein
MDAQRVFALPLVESIEKHAGLRGDVARQTRFRNREFGFSIALL